MVLSRWMLVIVAVAASASCEGGGSSTTVPTITGGEVVAPSAVKAAFESKLGATLDQVQDVEYAAPTDSTDQCTVVAIMTTADQVAVYRNAHDPVASNPAGTVGVKITATGDNNPCLTAAAQVLAQFK